MELINFYSQGAPYLLLMHVLERLLRAGVFPPEYLFLQRAETVVCRQLVTGNPCKYENYMMRHRMKLYNAYVHLIYVKVVGRRMKSLKTENKSCKLPLFPPCR